MERETVENKTARLFLAQGVFAKMVNVYGGTFIISTQSFMINMFPKRKRIQCDYNL